MRHFVTGATGFIGKHLAQQLVSAGHEAVALVRNPQEAGSLADLGVTQMRGDIADRESLRRDLPSEQRESETRVGLQRASAGEGATRDAGEHDEQMAMSTATIRNTEPGWFERVPKVELHLHLEGAIPHRALWELVQKYGGEPSIPDVQALERRFEYRDFPHFIETWVWKNQFLREVEDFTFIAEAVARDLAQQNVRYVEAFFSPADFARHGLAPQGLAGAIRRGLARVPEIEIALVADMVRDVGPDRAAIILGEVNEARDQGIVGIGLGGSEQDFPPEPFAQVYAEARRLGFHTTAHAGEAAGAQSIWGALRALHVERIGHGTRAAEDEALLDVLAERRIPLEMCPISNLRTGVIQTLEEHPARRYSERGIVVTINSDDPKMFGNSLADEYRALEQALGFSRDEIRTLILNAIRSAWLPEDRKRQLVAAFRQDPNWLEGAPPHRL